MQPPLNADKFPIKSGIHVVWFVLSSQPWMIIAHKPDGSHPKSVKLSLNVEMKGFDVLKIIEIK